MSKLNEPMKNREFTPEEIPAIYKLLDRGVARIEELERMEVEAQEMLLNQARTIKQLQSRIEDLEDKLHECLCGDLEVALGRIKELEAADKYLASGELDEFFSTKDKPIK